MWLHPRYQKCDNDTGFNWSQNKIRILGYTFGKNELQKEIESENWEKIYRNINTAIKKWQNIPMSLIGKKTVHKPSTTK